jgi:Acetoacetate decarboxylase (ADC)
MTYPPEPWLLRGRMRVAVWLVPVRYLPAMPTALARTVRVVRLGRRAVVGAAWVEYRPGGVLRYNELLAAVLTRAGLRPRVTITDIWVDSAVSRDGGRELWGIPKDIARFAFTGDHALAANDAHTLGEATIKRGLRLPGRWLIGFRVVQSLDGRPKTSRVRATARLSVGRSRWAIPPAGPMSHLARRQPLLTVTADDFQILFGDARAVPNAPAGNPDEARPAGSDSR